MLRVNDLDTPALVCDLDVLEANLKLMADRCRSLDIRLRPHTKSHKTPELARMQIAYGAQGITCQKLGGAEAMVAGGIDDILIPYNIVGRIKTERLARLAKQARLLTAVDSEITARGISEACSELRSEVGLVIELDTGSHRCGVQSPRDAVTLAQTIHSLPGVKFMGLMTYPSREEAKPFLEETLDGLRRSGLDCPVISGGGTGSEATSKLLGCTETRSGSYIWEGGSRIGKSDDLHPGRCPLRVLCTVVSTAVPGQMIIDGGRKTFTSMPAEPYYGHIVECPQAKMRGRSEEHGHVDLRECPDRFRVGDRVSVIPVHGNTVVNLHDVMYGVRGGIVETMWRVAGRGRTN